MEFGPGRSGLQGKGRAGGTGLRGGVGWEDVAKLYVGKGGGSDQRRRASWRGNETHGGEPAAGAGGWVDEGMEGGRQDVSWSERGRRVSVPVPQRGHVAWRGGLPLGGRSAAGAVGCQRALKVYQQ